jgi:DNA polymerase-4
VGKIPGVGKKAEKQLQALGVLRIRDFLCAGKQALCDRLGSYGEALYGIATGERFSSPEASRQEDSGARSLSHEETFSEDVQDGRLLDNTLADLAQRLARRLRHHGLFARSVTLKLRYSNFQTLIRARTLPEPAQLDGILLETARVLLRENWDTRRKVRLLGLQASGLEESAGQGNLLTAASDDKWSRVLAAADSLRERYGFRSVQLGAAVAGNARKEPVAAKAPPGPLRQDR